MTALHGVTNEGQAHSFLTGMLIALLGGHVLVMCTYILQLKPFVALKLELQLFPQTF